MFQKCYETPLFVSQRRTFRHLLDEETLEDVKRLIASDPTVGCSYRHQPEVQYLPLKGILHINYMMDWSSGQIVFTSITTTIQRPGHQDEKSKTMQLVQRIKSAGIRLLIMEAYYNLRHYGREAARFILDHF